MAKQADLVRSGLFLDTARAVVGTVETGITATASGTIDTSYALTAETSIISTAAASSGVRIAADVEVGDSVFVKNLGANSVNVFPPGGTVVINALAAGAALAVAAGGQAHLKRVSPTLFVTL